VRKSEAAETELADPLCLMVDGWNPRIGMDILSDP
jgi:hypothetical protein